MSQWPFEVLQPKIPHGPSIIFPIDRTAKMSTCEKLKMGHNESFHCRFFLIVDFKSKKRIRKARRSPENTLFWRDVTASHLLCLGSF